MSDTSKDDVKRAATQPKEAVIIKAFHTLKIKTGPGGFDPYAIIKASKRLESSAHLFPQVASHDISLIEDVLHMMRDEDSALALKKMLAPCVELKAHSAMFNFPLVTQVAGSLLDFCMRLSELTPIARDVASEHLRALKIAIEEGPRAITPEDHVNLLQGLEKAVHKALRQQQI